jgi:hypothetical protein
MRGLSLQWMSADDRAMEPSSNAPAFLSVAWLGSLHHLDNQVKSAPQGLAP